MRRRAASCVLTASYGVRFSERCGLMGATEVAAAAGDRDEAGAFTMVRTNPVFTAPLVGVHELKYALETVPERVRVLDGSWHGAASKHEGKHKFLQGHIPEARFFDIERIRNTDSPLPRMLPKADVFSRHVSDLGISNSHHVVVYGGPDTASAARVWWMFNVFAHKNVHILQGGLQAWADAGLEFEHGEKKVQSTRRSRGMVTSSRGCLGSGDWKLARTGFQSQLRPALYRTARQVLACSEGSVRGAIVDARPTLRFTGLMPEPAAPDLPRGYIPNSISLPWESVVTAGNSQQFKSAEELRQVFHKAGVDLALQAPIVSTCSSGITAAMLSFALHLCGRDPSQNPVFDGSWAEWASGKFPIVKPAKSAPAVDTMR